MSLLTTRSIRPPRVTRNRVPRTFVVTTRTRYIFIYVYVIYMRFNSLGDVLRNTTPPCIIRATAFRSPVLIVAQASRRRTPRVRRVRTSLASGLGCGKLPPDIRNRITIETTCGCACTVRTSLFI